MASRDAVSALERLDDGLWKAEGPIVDFFGFAYPTRMLAVRLRDGGVWLWSPVAFSPPLAAGVAALGPVRHLVAPNKIHHLWLNQWVAAFPAAMLWGPRSLILRRQDLNFGGALEADPPADWAADIDQAWFTGSPIMDEVVFFHRASGTVIVADLIENFGDDFLKSHWSRWQRPLARLDGITAAAPGAPREWRLSFLNRIAARAARDRLLKWPVRRVVMAHGAIVNADAPAFLEKALAWLD